MALGLAQGFLRIPWNSQEFCGIPRVQVNSMNNTRLLQALTRLESKVPFPKAVGYMFYPTPALITAQQEALNKYFEALCLDDVLMTSMGQLQHLIRS